MRELHYNTRKKSKYRKENQNKREENQNIVQAKTLESSQWGKKNKTERYLISKHQKTP